MNIRTPTLALTALVLGIAAGGASTVYAGEPVAVSTPGEHRLDFRSGEWLLDRKVVNDNGEVIAKVSDLILERGSGRIEFLVIKTGSALGGGRQAIAIPYSAFRAESGGADRFVLASTAEQLKQYPEYSPQHWKSLREPELASGNSLRQTLDDNGGSATSDPYAGGMTGAEQLRVEGEVTSVERVRTSTFGEQVVMTVKTADGSSRQVAMGPSWFVNANSAAPMRGDRVIVETLTLPRDPARLLVGTTLRSDDRNMRMRAADGTPAWGLRTVEAGGKSYGSGYSRYLLLSELDGMVVDCRGVECGKVDQVLLDRTSGEIGFLSIDPNENFMGINDTKRLIPWSVATVVLDGKVRIDASKEMVISSMETPSDPSSLNAGSHGENVYKAFGVPAPRYEQLDHTRSVPTPSADAWTIGGSVMQALETDKAHVIEGTVSDVTEVRFDRGVATARAIRVRTAGGGEEIVLLGPVQYMDAQKPVCKNGDTVKVHASWTTVNGNRHLLARSVECKASKVVLIDGANAPAWARR